MQLSTTGRRDRVRAGGRADRGLAAGHPTRIVLALAIGIAVLGLLTAGLAGLDGVDPRSASQPGHEFDLSAEGYRGSVTLDHVAGEPIAVADLTVTVAVDGERLRHQPPVPFVGAVGFDGAPRGPFNARAGGTWYPGEPAGFRVAEGNDPSIEPGDRVRVTLAVDGRTIARLETTAA